jgi:peptidoglycan-N-acetylglucosamine deacetylase
LLWLVVALLAVADGRLLLPSAEIAVTIQGQAASLAAGSTVQEALRRRGMRPGAGDLLAVDRTVLKPRVYPARVMVNGEPARLGDRLHGGDRVTVEAGRDRVEPAVRTVRQVPAVVPGNPVRALAVGPVEQVLARGKLSGRVATVAFRPAAGPPTPLPVALTFDDGPWPRTTEQILSVLARMRAPATFFVVGRQVERHPALVRRQLAAGMAVGTHSFGHPPSFDRLPAAGVRGEIVDGLRTLGPLGVRPVGFRPPGGAASPAVVAAAEGAGQRTVLWNVDPVDWRPGVTSEQLVRRVLAQARPGAIILLHDGGGDRSATVAALPAIITGLRRLGLTLTVLGG